MFINKFLNNLLIKHALIKYKKLKLLTFRVKMNFYGIVMLMTMNSIRDLVK